MCGRYTLRATLEELAEELGPFEETGGLDGYGASYNVAPTREVPAVLRGEGGGRRLEVLRWGLVPSWADDPGIGARMINARSETAAEKPSFRAAFRSRRCLIPADGFYEWRKDPRGGKQPFFFRLKDERPFAFAGLWERWERDGQEIRSCAILTTAANGVVGEVHERMPVILPRDARDAREAWLDPEAEKEELVSLLAPYPDAEMGSHPVSRFVNSPKNDAPRCVEPAA